MTAAKPRLSARVKCGGYTSVPTITGVTSAGYLRYPHIHGDLLAFVAGDEVWLEHGGGLSLLVEDLVHSPATDGQVGIAKIGIGLRQRDCDVIRPSTQTIGA